MNDKFVEKFGPLGVNVDAIKILYPSIDRVDLSHILLPAGLRDAKSQIASSLNAAIPDDRGFLNSLLSDVISVAIVSYYQGKANIRQEKSFFSRIKDNDHGLPAMKRAIYSQGEIDNLAAHYGGMVSPKLTNAYFNFMKVHLQEGEEHFGPTSFKACLMRSLSILFLYNTTPNNDFIDEAKEFSELIHSKDESHKAYANTVLEPLENGTSKEQIIAMLDVVAEIRGNIENAQLGEAVIHDKDLVLQP